MRVDTNYVYDLNHPKDHTLVGSSELGRTGEVQVQQLGIGGDFHYENVRGRLLTQYGMYSTMTPRNDASPNRGQWDLANAYRNLNKPREAKNALQQAKFPLEAWELEAAKEFNVMIEKTGRWWRIW